MIGMTDQEKRIKLAEAMGWTIWRMPNEYLLPDRKTVAKLPDPYTDANDDYAVLEWMRKDAPQEQHIAFVCDVDFTALNYQIGDYARAALKVIATHSGQPHD